MRVKCTTTPERFLAYSNQVPDGCWVWLGPVTKAGYGQLWTGEKRITAHRFSYEFYVGPIPEGFVVDHLCRNKRCVNPAHLEAVTNIENLIRGNGKHVSALLTNVCCRGHELTPDNVSISNGCRSCKRCIKEWKLKNRSKSGVPHDGSVLRKCTVCSKDYPLLFGNQKCCSAECASLRKKALARERRIQSGR